MKQSSHILICDDQMAIHQTLGAYLDSEGFTYTSAYDGAEALKKAKEVHPDLIILDIMMPKKSGIDVCREIRQSSRTPIIMLTAKDEEIDRILGLELGADDYIVKPFSVREVIARVKAVLRRMNTPEEEAQDVLRFHGLEIYLSNYEIRFAGKRLAFTPKEVEILHLLASHPGRVYEREEILSHVWGYDYFGDTRVVDTHIKRIRQKLSMEDMDWGIKTVYGIGYKFEAGK